MSQARTPTVVPPNTTSPVTVRDIQFLYGNLWTAHQIEELGLDPEYAKYLTPSEAWELEDTPDSLVVVNIDVTGENPQYEGVDILTYTADLADKVAHSHYYAARGRDFSITHKTGASTGVKTVGKYAVERFTKWPFDDGIPTVIETHDDGWIIEAIAELGEDENAMNQLKSDVVDALSGTKYRLVTIRVRGANDDDELSWPGEIPVLMDAMKARIHHNLANKNKATDSKGTGTCYVTGDDGAVYGCTEDPLFLFSTKQRDAFQNLDGGESWRTQPVSLDAALLIRKSGAVIERCRYTVSGARMYVFPYFVGEQNPDKLDALREVLVEQVAWWRREANGDADDGSPVPRIIERFVDNIPEAHRSDLHFHLIALDRQESSLSQGMYTVLDTAGVHLFALADAHHDAINRVETSDWLPWFTTENSVALNPNVNHVDLVSSPWYFRETMPKPDANDDPRTTAAFFAANRHVLEGTPIPLSELCDAYAERLNDEWEPGDGINGVPSFVAASQYVQLCALSESGLLVRSSTDQTTVEFCTQMSETATGDEPPNGDLSSTDLRKQHYDQFIQNHALLRDDYERRAAFTFGALVGLISQYQRYPLETNPLAGQYTSKVLTKHNFNERLSQVLDLLVVYSENADVDVRGTMYSEMTDRLNDDMQHADPEDWSISLNELRTHYAHGLVWGVNINPGSDSTADE